MRGHTTPRKFCQRRKETRQWQNLLSIFSFFSFFTTTRSPLSKAHLISFYFYLTGMFALLRSNVLHKGDADGWRNTLPAAEWVICSSSGKNSEPWTALAVESTSMLAMNGFAKNLLFFCLGVAYVRF